MIAIRLNRDLIDIICQNNIDLKKSCENSYRNPFIDEEILKKYLRQTATWHRKLFRFYPSSVKLSINSLLMCMMK